MSRLDFEEALTQELETITELNDRIYPLTAPEERFDLTRPYLIFGSSEGARDKSLDGYLGSKEIRAELNVIAPRYEHMKAITKKVVALLIGMEGRSIGTDGPFIEELEYQAPVELYESQPKLYRSVVEFTVYFDEED